MGFISAFLSSSWALLTSQGLPPPLGEPLITGGVCGSVACLGKPATSVPSAEGRSQSHEIVRPGTGLSLSRT